ncbi:MAG: Crp/Fnr family transcriptional regulator [Chryseobacterium sp.]|nr:MAG: Crp/Fnr family transcriptional regulator [Chryseobacterium sp.]
MFEKLKHQFSLNDKEWDDFKTYFERMEIAPKTSLLHEGEVSSFAYFIEKGIVRAYYNNDGKDLTFQFFSEENMFSSIESFRKNIPSLVGFETIEPCVLWRIHKNDAEKILQKAFENSKMRTVFLDKIFERTFSYMKHFFSFIKDSPQQRYINLSKKHPEIIKRVPQHYIASYLGITTVHLSRIKSKILKEK